jgi:hypothetical protein
MVIVNKLQFAALEMIFQSQEAGEPWAEDVFVDYITEIYETEPDFNEIVINGSNVIFLFQGPDYNNAEWDDEEDDYDYDNIETMIIGVIFKPGEEGADIKWIKNK